MITVKNIADNVENSVIRAKRNAYENYRMIHTHHVVVLFTYEKHLQR